MSSNSRWLYRLIYLGLVSSTLFTSSLIALYTQFGAHPDERLHVDTFRFFETHLWPPDLNSDEIVYSPDGWSRVYNGEIVYMIYGQVGGLFQRLLQPETEAEAKALRFQVYRLLNVLLLAITLFVLFYSRSQVVSPAIIGFVLVCIPQIIYLYSYANSDAWGVSVSLFLFLVVLAQWQNPFSAWPWSRVVLLGLLTGLIFLAKEPYWLTPIFCYPLLIISTLPELGEGSSQRLSKLSLKLVLLLFVILIVSAPLKIIYPLTQTSYALKVEEMREARAREDFKPSHPTYEGYRLASKGVSFSQLVSNKAWFELSIKSFYGIFGYFNVHPSRWIYRVAAGAFLTLTLFTYWSLVKAWPHLPNLVKFLLIWSPFLLGLNILMSLYHSWQIDFQPQGRYLFASLAPLSMMLWGTLFFEGRERRLARGIILLALYGLCLYTLYFVVLPDPNLTRS